MSSRIARKPISVPNGVTVSFNKAEVVVKGSNGQLSFMLSTDVVKVEQDDNVLNISAVQDTKHAKAMSGTTRALIHNMVTGVSEGFHKKLQLVGVGYRGQVQGKTLTLALGFSHPVHFTIPDGIDIKVEKNQTELVVSGCDKQRVGQIAANIRSYRPPEPYKGKGVRYADEKIIIKEIKK